ncbi:MAG TPA: copper resistance protein CopC [Candidatus Dormibacteraeota bacterium]|nr:copper resistance protein CopC [Candidatus Dormibacteraeota bacterium]
MTGVAAIIRFLAGLGMATALTVAAAVPASAHATLIASNPGNGAVLASAPDQVMFQFDVPVNPQLSAVRLTDRAGHRIDGYTINAAGGVSSLLTIALPPLPQGVYRMDFRARDDTDLHETGGAIVFGVGQVADYRVQPEVVPGPSYVETGTRWLELAGTCLLVGIVAVWLGILPAAGRRRPVTAAARARLLGLAVLGYGAFVIGKLGQLLVAAAGLGAGAARSWPAALGTALTAGRFGWLWLGGMGLAALTLVAVRFALGRQGSRRAAAALLLAIAALLVVSTATSHGANQAGPDPLLIAIRAIHLAAAGLWVGGLTVLVFLFTGALRGGSPEGPAALIAFRRFTGLAFIAVGVLTVTGLLLVDRGVASAAQLITTNYGLTLVAKLIAGAAALAFGVRHSLLLSPPRGGGVGGPVKLARSVPFEVGTMLVVLWGAAALGATAPAPMPTATPAAGITPDPTDITAQIQDLSVRTSMEPGRPGRNSLVVQVHGAGAADPVSDVQVVLAQPGQMTQTLNAHPLGGGRYDFPPVQLAEAGRLDVQVTVSRVDGSLARTNWTWTVAPLPQTPPPGLPAAPWANDLYMAAAVLAVALLSAWATWLLLDRRRRSLGRPAAGQ